MLNILIPIVLLTAGILSGGLINYLADVLPRDRKLNPPECGHCGTTQNYAAYFINPVIYSKCGHRRPLRHILVVLGASAAALWMWYYPPGRIGGVAGFILLVYFGLVVVIDLEHKLILHPVMIAGIFICGVVGFWRHGLVSTFIGGISGFGIMLGLYWLGGQFSKWMSRRRGEPVDEVALGFGDVNLAGVIGLLLGWPGILPALILAILLGGAGSLIYLVWMWLSRQYQAFAAIPYGPFLVLGAVILLFS